MTHLSLTHRLLAAKTRANGIPSRYCEISDPAGKGHPVLDSICLPDGFYRIVQTSDQGQVNDATLCLPAPGVKPADLNVKMDTSNPFAGSQVWKLTNQYGVDKGYTIVPLDDPIPELNGEGGTTYNIDNYVKVKRSNLFPIWNVVCVMMQKFYDDVTHEEVTVYLFRIIENGTKRCWNTKDSNVALEPIASVTDGRGNHVPSPVQRYEIILVSRINERVEKKTVDTVSVTATSDAIVRKYYFGTDAIPASELKSFLSLQVETDSRNQGWASDPTQGLWSTFEVAILTSVPKPGEVVDKQIKRVGDKLCTWLSHTLPLSGEYQEQTGVLFDHCAEIWKYLESGNAIGVLACARFPAWRCEARRGNLNIEKLAWVPPPDPKVSL